MGKSSSLCNRLTRCPQGSNYQFVLISLNATIAATGVGQDCCGDVAQSWRKKTQQTVERVLGSCPWRATSRVVPLLYSLTVAVLYMEYHFYSRENVALCDFCNPSCLENFFSLFSLVSLCPLLIFHGPLVNDQERGIFSSGNCSHFSLVRWILTWVNTKWVLVNCGQREWWFCFNPDWGTKHLTLVGDWH